MPRLQRLLAAAAAATALGAPAALAPAPASAATTWLCRPGLADDACSAGLTTSSFSPTGRLLGVQRPRIDADRRVDCFYVYPTVSGEAGEQASLAKRPEILSIARYQVARYRQHCRIYAPVYRQLTLAGIGAAPEQQAAAAAVAYGDVKAAFKDYLRHDNHGRGFVLIGHSQGSAHLTRLIREVVDPSPRLRRRMVSAILLGGNVMVRRGRDTGGDFEHVRPCRRPGQTGCVVAFSTFGETPPAETQFGRFSRINLLSGTPTKHQDDLEVLCTNPAALRGGTARLDTVFPNEPFAPGTAIAAGISLLGFTQPAAPTPWVAIPRGFDGRCSGAGGAHVLRITARGGSPTLKASPDPTWGLHLVDANIALGDLVRVVGRQVRAYERRVSRAG
jgi:Protein of unknown function (DUF3089)